jgi:chemotaxis protein methyltransferase CheR
MKNRLPDSLLSQLSEFVAARTALHFPRNRWSDLEQRTSSAAEEFGFIDEEAFIQWLVSSPLTREQTELLASHLTNSETYFWREPQVFGALQGHILPELIRSRERGEKRLRIWSAGCATGEEPYSIAIALRTAIPTPGDWYVTILATDINPRILRRAKAGVYGEWSFRNVPAWLRKDNFCRKKDGRLEILPEIRKMVTFSYLNLAEDIYPSPLNNTNAMDLIFCRNVLMYFAPERATQVVHRLYRSLVDGGWLMVSASELSQQIFSHFIPVHFPGAIVYRRVRQESRPPVVFRLEEMSGQEASLQPPLPAFAGVEQAPLPSPFRNGEKTPEIVKPSLREKACAETFECSAPEDDRKAPPAIAFSVRALADQGKLAEALAACEEGIAADKLDPELHYLRAIIFQEQDRETEATASFKAALYLEPNFVPAHFALGNLLLRRGKRRAAKKCFDNVLALLSACGREEILPESEGLTAARFREIVHATMQVWE